jgi:predicted nucleic acid-binding protein
LAEAPVVDASPLILLSRAGQLDLLQVLGTRIDVPAAVVAEIRAKSSDEAVRALQDHPWLTPVANPPLTAQIARLGLGSGESAVLGWALSHPGCIAILDDFEGRRCARGFRIPVIGTLGIVLAAKRVARISHARPVVESLVAHGMYLSASVRERALALVGE